MKKYFFVLVLLIVAAVILVATHAGKAPDDFPSGTIITIDQGESLKSIAQSFHKKYIIRSPFLFETAVIFYGGDRKIVDGYYFFKAPISVFEVARRVARGDRQIPEIKITFPEGFTRAEMADAAAVKFDSFSKEEFLQLSKDKEGYLFPDTYFFFPFSTAPDMIAKMQSTFEKKIATVQSDIDASGHSLSDVIIMASLVEKESSGNGDRAVISGILWKRLAKGIALQVDASPDTYNHKGLPGSAIANPGMAAIQAALHPEDSPYLFYLHDKDGNVHFAKTFDEHKQNIARYLK